MLRLTILLHPLYKHIFTNTFTKKHAKINFSNKMSKIAIDVTNLHSFTHIQTLGLSRSATVANCFCQKSTAATLMQCYTIELDVLW